MFRTERVESLEDDEPRMSRGRHFAKSRRSAAFGARAKVLHPNKATKYELELGRLLYPPRADDPPRPKTRAECAQGVRPCPFVSCRYHLAVDVDCGVLKVNFPDLELEEMGDTCALDVADRGGVTLDETGAAMNVTREAVRIMERAALAKVEARRFLPLVEHWR